LSDFRTLWLQIQPIIRPLNQAGDRSCTSTNRKPRPIGALAGTSGEYPGVGRQHHRAPAAPTSAIEPITVMCFAD
jgi:hypothetical protein